MVEPTKLTMTELHKQYEPNIYDGAGHGFLRQRDERNPANQKATEQAWPTTIEFLKKNLK